jgi:transcriptional regulator with XRE-family HTH domain
MITVNFMEKEKVLIKIGLRIKELREEKNISQQDLAAACNFEKSNMSRIEAGRTNLTIGTLLKIGERLKVRLVDLVDVEENG